MNVLRRTIYFFLLSFLFFSCKEKNRSEFAEGDILMQQINCGPLCDAINKVTDGYKGKDYNHCALVVKIKDSLQVVEAIGEKVQINSLNYFFARVGDDTNTIKNSLHCRLKNEFQSLIPVACKAAIGYKDLPYDDLFLLNNNKMYCSEIIYEAFKKANQNRDFFVCKAMTYKDPATNQFFPPWQDYYKSFHAPIPEGELGINPGAISLSDKLEVLDK
jgi:uncharacterized protein YycO